jgi:heme/copper-type cytochrome/quinol oxidase subunit 2
MIIEYIITTWLSAIVLALTPSDRWAAAKELNTDSTVPYWFIWSVGIAITVLVVSFIVVIYKQRSQRARRAK